jgi:ureidoacrylate peracid hydrolase
MGREFVPTLDKLISACREAGVLVIYTAQMYGPNGTDRGRDEIYSEPVRRGEALVAGTPGVAIYDPIAPMDEDVIIEKHRYNAFFGTDLEIVLRGSDVETVIIAGVTTENCCATTARGAHARDYRVVFLTDVTGTSADPDQGFGEKSAQAIHEMACTIIGTNVGTLATSQEVLNSLGIPGANS